MSTRVRSHLLCPQPSRVPPPWGQSPGPPEAHKAVHDLPRPLHVLPSRPTHLAHSAPATQAPSPLLRYARPSPAPGLLHGPCPLALYHLLQDSPCERNTLSPAFYLTRMSHTYRLPRPVLLAPPRRGSNLLPWCHPPPQDLLDSWHIHKAWGPSLMPGLGDPTVWHSPWLRRHWNWVVITRAVGEGGHWPQTNKGSKTEFFF